MNTKFLRSLSSRGLSLAATTLALGLGSAPASATLFAAFVEHEPGFDAQLRGDGYPGRMKLLNQRGSSACVYFRYLDDQNQPLRVSPTGAKVPAGRQDLSVTGPGVNSRRLEVHVGAPQNEWCGRFTQIPSQNFISVSAGEVKQGGGYEVDARTWSGNSRDITVRIR